MDHGTRDPSPWLPALAGALVEALPRLVGERPDPLLSELITALTAALERGELALDLDGPAPEGLSCAAWPEGHRQALQASGLLREPDGPLLLEGSQLGWRRWQSRRRTVLDALVRRASRSLPLEPGPGSEGDTDLADLDPLQRQAVAAVRRHHLVLLQGGPGTGKTRTVARLLDDWRRQQPQARVRLAAPTGKAAARLRAATAGREECVTLHRLLESRGEQFGRNRRQPLALDLLVVDEVSMLDLELMAALLDALPEDCRLVLVGDPAQLPPIAPGAVLLDLQRPEWVAALGEARIELATSYRNDGAIAAVAALLRQGSGDPIAAIRPRLLQLEPHDNLQWQEASSQRLPEAMLSRLQQHRSSLEQLAAACRPGESQGCEALLAERDRLLVLAPLRRGRWGIEAIHRALLGPAALAPVSGWPSGTPVLCCRNLAELGLANGDLGVVVRAEGENRLLFGSDTPLWLHPAQLSGALEPALALTVHKAQGSEAAEVIALMPERDDSDGRLLYTALTRARQRALLITASR